MTIDTAGKLRISKAANVQRTNDPLQGIAVPLAVPFAIPAIYNAETIGREQQPNTKKRSILAPVYGKA